MSNIYLNNGDADIAISMTQHGSERFRLSLYDTDSGQLAGMLKDAELSPGERRDVLNALASHKTEEFAEVANNPDSSNAEINQVTEELARMMALGSSLKRGDITEAGLNELSAALGLQPGAVHLPVSHKIIEN
jgi:ATP phosphoribosyltransferase regulatory subunit HisZ